MSVFRKWIDAYKMKLAFRWVEAKGMGESRPSSLLVACLKAER
jgi:hypothetical protein